MIADSVLKVASVSSPHRRVLNTVVGFGILAAYMFACTVLLDKSQGAIVTGSAGILLALLAIWQGWLLLRSSQFARLHGRNLLVLTTFLLAIFLMNREGHGHEQASGARLQVILNQVGLTLSNAIIGANLLERKAQSVLAPTDIVAVCELACSDAGPDWEKRIELISLHEPIVVSADPILLRLALRNLLENAERHSPLDRKVVMAVQADDPPGRVTLSVVNWPVDVFVADNRLFERGVRGALPVGDGEGLGLHIVKEVASLHDAEISARVRPDRRTEFVISLPLPGDFSVSKAAR